MAASSSAQGSPVRGPGAKVVPRWKLRKMRSPDCASLWSIVSISDGCRPIVEAKGRGSVQGALVLSQPCCIPQAIEEHLLVPIEAPGDFFGRLVEQYDAFQREILPPADHPRLLKSMEYDAHRSFL